MLQMTIKQQEADLKAKKAADEARLKEAQRIQREQDRILLQKMKEDQLQQEKNKKAQLQAIKDKQKQEEEAAKLALNL